MNRKASIVILTYNNIEYTRLCLESIYAKTRFPDFEVILVDNASQDGTQPFLDEFAASHPNVHLIFNAQNEGFARGNNIGADIARGQYLVFLNNDVVVTDGWLTSLIHHLQDSQVGMVGPVSNSSGNETRIEVDYEELDEMHAFAASYTEVRPGQAFEIRMLPFQCVVMRRAVFEEIGPLDERFGIGMFEDDDYAIRLKQAGYKLLCAEDVFLHHWGSASFSKLDMHGYWQLFKENLDKFEDKWGIHWLPNMQRAQFIPEQLRQALDNSLYFADLLLQQDQYIKRMEDRLDTLETLAVEKKLHAEQLELQLQEIYQSDGWAFLQSMLSIRRKIIPEGSRREGIFQSLLRAMRDFSLGDLTRDIKAALSREKPPHPEVPSSPAASEPGFKISPQPIDINARIAWPLISVLLPVYNHAKMLEGAASSVLHSTYPNLELIILDDGSTDKVESVLSHLSTDPRVRIYRQPNQKLPRALTHAHQLAQGEFITWTSSDNLLAPNALETLAEALLTHPDSMLVYADVAVIDVQGNKLLDGTYRSKNQDPEERDVIRLYRNALSLGYEMDNFINACFLYRREAANVLEGQYADDLRGLEDFDFWLRLQKCGPFYHVHNKKPLYNYRVHKETISHDILSQEQERDAHAKRAQQLITYENQRRVYSQQRWHLIPDESLSASDQGALLDVAQQLPVDTHAGLASAHRKKELRFVPPNSDCKDRIYVEVFPHSWRLVWESFLDISSLGQPSPDRDRPSLELWKGVDIHPLALKARDHQPDRWEIPGSGQLPILGFHFPLEGAPLDILTTRQVISNNPNTFFVFIDVPTIANPSLGQKLVENQENAAYLGARPFGEAYQLYACFDAVWLPPVSAASPAHIYQSHLGLAYAIGRPLLVPSGLDAIPAPYQFHYSPPDDNLDFIHTFKNSQMDTHVLDQYLDTWTPAARLAQLTRFANAITQEATFNRPDFGTQAPPRTSPTSWPLPSEDSAGTHT